MIALQDAETDLAAGTTIGAARRILAGRFRAAGLDSPELDARLLVGFVLGLDLTGLASAADKAIAASDARRISALALRRLAHEPVARILGTKEFWGLPLTLGRETLVPRPETETLVEAALAVWPDREAPLRIADLGTGSGALLLALLHEYRNAAGIGTDRSEGAILVARDNAQTLGLSNRAAFAVCDFSSALAGGFDCVVSNPPYIASVDIDTLAPDVREFDPRLALDGGAEGLSAYRRIAADAPRLIAPRGALIVELGAGQEQAVTAIMSAQRLTAESPARRDLAGIPRALTLRPLP